MKSLPLFHVARGLALLFTLAVTFPADAADAVDLRGYGKVAADITPTRCVFTCESVEKADLLMDKLQADLTWDQNLPLQKSDLKVGSNTVSVYAAPGYGAAVIARSGTSVLVLGATDSNEAASLAAKEPLLQGGDVTSHAATPHPFLVDYYDNKAFKCYVPAMKSYPPYTMESHWPFLKKFGMCEASFGPFFHNECPAPGVIDWTRSDYEVQSAERNHDMTVVMPDGGGEVPFWVSQWDHDTMMQGSDTTLLGDWGGASMVGAHYESWGTPVEERTLTGLGFLEQVMKRYRSSPSVGGWMLFAGSPGVEYNFHARTMHSWDHSPAGQQSWRNWVRDVKHWSLADVGRRWYGDADHFSSWKDVTVPDINQFYGAMGDDTLQIDSGWKWQNTEEKGDGPIAPDAPGWIPTDRPPSQSQSFLPRTGINYFDVTFDATSWLKKVKAGGDVWLVFGMNGTGNKGIDVWVNDQAQETPVDPQSRNWSFAVKVTGQIKPGPNHLQVAINGKQFQLCGGKLSGPVFLTAHEPKRAPELGRGMNALNADLIDWQCWAMTDYHSKMFDLARKIDPDRPYVLSGGADPLYNYTVKLAVDYGMGVENTGREASYRPHLPGLALAAGFYSTSEESATPDIKDPVGDYFQREFGWIMFDADSSHCCYHDIDAYQKREDQDGWFTQHARQIQLFGKYLRVQPQIALLMSAESERLDAAKGNDVGVGELEQAHYDNVYVTEDGVKEGIANRYPVLFDTGSQFMEKETVDAIRQYVEQGGTFVALNDTGIDTALDPESYPLSDLSGFQVATTGKHGKIRFESKLPVFKGWENKEFEGWGHAVDWLKEDHAQEGNLALKPGDSSAIPLARWDDGTVAIGYRKVGKGQVITLGSTFWRDGKDVSGVWVSSNELEAQFFERLFTDLGINRTANASIPQIWDHKMVTKNGLQNWLLAINSQNGPEDADLWMATDSQPTEVIDLQTNTSVPFAYENGGVTIKGVHFDPYAVKTYAVRRGTLTSGLSVWWDEKTTYWKRTPVQIAAETTVLPPPEKNPGANVLPLKGWKFKTDEDHAISTAGKWLADDFDDSGWKVITPGAWNLFDPALKDYHGSALYRVKFTVPDSWKGRQILFNLFDYDTPIVYGQATFSINGTQVATYKTRGWSQTLNYDVSAQVHPGENILTLEVAGDPNYGGLSGPVWIESRVPLSQTVDLGGTWQAVQADWLTRTDFTVPGKTKAKYVTRDVAIPADWKDKKVLVEWSSQEQWVGSLVVNGHPIGYNGACHPFGLISRIDVTPYLKPGENNNLQFWSINTVSRKTDKEDESGGFQFDTLKIGTE